MQLEEKTLIVVAAKPGVMRNSLLSYLRTIPNAQVIAVVGSALIALDTIREWQPSLVVVDSDLTEWEMETLLRQLQGELPHIKSIALVESIRQQQVCLAAGANVALLKGFLDEQLRQAVLTQAHAHAVQNVSSEQKENLA